MAFIAENKTTQAADSQFLCLLMPPWTLTLQSISRLRLLTSSFLKHMFYGFLLDAVPLNTLTDVTPSSPSHLSPLSCRLWHLSVAEQYFK